MNKITYKDYTVITRSDRTTTDFNGMLIRVKFAKRSISILETFCRKIGIYLRTTNVYFWCPLKSILSINTYGAIGKKSRGKYSNLWFELNSANVENLKYLTKNATQRFNFLNWIRDCKFQKVTNKKLKEYLDQYLPNITIQK